MMLMCLPLCLLYRQLFQPIAREDHRRQVNTKADWLSDFLLPASCDLLCASQSVWFTETNR